MLDADRDRWSATPAAAVAAAAPAATAFACQKCGELLRLHSSLSDLQPEALAELAGAAAVLLQPALPSEAGKMSDSETNGNGFLIIGDPGAAPKRPAAPLDHRDLSYRLQVTARLFDVLSDQSEVKHPLCEECADFVIDQMDARLRQTEEECKVYRECEEALRASAQDHEEERRSLAELAARLELLQQEERQLQQELQLVQQQEREARLEAQRQDADLAQLEQQETRCWREYNDLKRCIFASEDELQSVTNQLRYTQAQLEKLKRSNVFNVTFHIWHCGHFGTINGFRLGRLPTVPVEWSEINAAWGQAALLLHCMAKKINLTFQRFRLVPYGNFSFLQSLDDRSKQLPLSVARLPRLCSAHRSLCPGTRRAASASCGTSSSTRPWSPSWTACSSSRRKWRRTTPPSVCRTAWTEARSRTCRRATRTPSSKCLSLRP